MSDYMSLFDNSANPLQRYLNAMDRIRGNVHGGARAFMDSLPVSGSIRKWKNEIKKADDRYRNSGIDEAYSSPYNANMPFLNDALGTLVRPARMARTLMKMYGAEVALDVQETRLRANMAQTRAAHAWQTYEMMRSHRSDY